MRHLPELKELFVAVARLAKAENFKIDVALIVQGRFSDAE
jgi:hypothetical protein